jgi:hypothetical protein
MFSVIFIVPMSCFSTFLFAIFTILLSSLAYGQKTATMEVYSRSAQVLSHTTTNGTVVYFTSYDGLSIQPRNDEMVFSEELAPSADNPATYRMDYAVYFGTTVLEYGAISLNNMPTSDEDQNGFPDWLQKDKGVSFTVNGNLDIQWPTSARATIPITFSFLRNAGNHIGNIAYGYSILTNEGWVNFEGYSSWLVSNFSGNIAYDSQGNFEVSVSDFRNGVTFGFFGEGDFSVQGEDTFRITSLAVSDTVYNYSIYPSDLQRINEQYRGEVSFVEGNFATSWTDYESWYFIIEDQNDSDSDGIPDLTDIEDNSQSGTSISNAGWNYHAWPWVYSSVDQGWQYYAVSTEGFLLWREKDGKWYAFNTGSGKWDLLY